MIEVETKIKIEKPEEYRKKVKKIGRFVCKQKKIDDYYTLEELSHYPEKSLRIRKKDSAYEINFKRKNSYDSGIYTKKETEFTISDISSFLKLIQEFGFKHWLRKEKTTELYEIKKNFHIEINKVKNLGWFLEVEYLAKPNEVEKAKKEILKIVKKLEIKQSQIIKEGYTKMLWNKNIVGF